MLLGWVHRVRDLGGVLFFDLRDRHGLTQVVVRERQRGGATWRRRSGRSSSSPCAARSTRAQPATRQSEAATRARSRSSPSTLEILNEAKTPPFPINEDAPVAEETRLRYRYLDLRRPALQQNLVLRHKVALAARRYFDAQGFLEIETPILTRSTPEGARDYLVPSRVHPASSSRCRSRRRSSSRS